MKLRSVAAMLSALNDAEARVLVVGGLAVNAHGQPPVLARYVALPTLIAMKEAVGRPQDLDDAQHLRWIQEEMDK